MTAPLAAVRRHPSTRPIAITTTGHLTHAPDRTILTTHELATLARLGIARHHTPTCDDCPGHPMADITTGDTIVIGRRGHRAAYRITAGRAGIWRLERIA